MLYLKLRLLVILLVKPIVANQNDTTSTTTSITESQTTATTSATIDSTKDDSAVIEEAVHKVDAPYDGYDIIILVEDELLRSTDCSHKVNSKTISVIELISQNAQYLANFMTLFKSKNVFDRQDVTFSLVAVEDDMTKKLTPIYLDADAFNIIAKYTEDNAKFATRSGLRQICRHSLDKRKDRSEKLWQDLDGLYFDGYYNWRNESVRKTIVVGLLNDSYNDNDISKTRQIIDDITRRMDGKRSNEDQTPFKDRVMFILALINAQKRTNLWKTENLMVSVCSTENHTCTPSMANFLVDKKWITWKTYEPTTYGHRVLTTTVTLDIRIVYEEISIFENTPLIAVSILTAVLFLAMANLIVIIFCARRRGQVKILDRILRKKEQKHAKTESPFPENTTAEKSSKKGEQDQIRSEGILKTTVIKSKVESQGEKGDPPSGGEGGFHPLDDSTVIQSLIDSQFPACKFTL